MKNMLANEKGNIALFVLGMLSIIMILFIFVLNLGGALATKEKSATTAQQASLTASSVFYEEMRAALNRYEFPEPESDDEEPEDSEDEEDDMSYEEYFNEKLNDKISDLSSLVAYSDWSANEIELEAFDQVLSSEASTRADLLFLLRSQSFRGEVITAVKDAIHENGGVLEEAELIVKNNRFYVRAANEFESTSLNGVVDEIKENVYQETAGPKIDFLNLVWGENETIPLDED
ncbi:Tad domain-containing protein [Tenuibacillus multivorans]|uniref:Putative Flp pilus-assembly TadE/G-like n=1 Tax=Tenuibacillus multivorans TaxID=237069 RepID=A0A1G9WJB8_9BACI|nr:Tad domain-containing protein [Tenuibacillus multivorans]GEL76473.1 hypothetical protein TMU01_07080 [Tenuibacillus multivorans]SDM84135.1 Putative Flp pilus-assembly TadE/G-like [Tenuibacillus multivorans]